MRVEDAPARKSNSSGCRGKTVTDLSEVIRSFAGRPAPELVAQLLAISAREDAYFRSELPKRTSWLQREQAETEKWLTSRSPSLDAIEADHARDLALHAAFLGKKIEPCFVARAIAGAFDAAAGPALVEAMPSRIAWGPHAPRKPLLVPVGNVNFKNLLGSASTRPSST